MSCQPFREPNEQNRRDIIPYFCLQGSSRLGQISGAFALKESRGVRLLMRVPGVVEERIRYAAVEALWGGHILIFKMITFSADGREMERKG